MYSNSPEADEERASRKFDRQVKLKNHRYSEKQMKEIRDIFFQWEPVVDRFNKIIGYAELKLDWNEIVVYYHLNGDGRRRYNTGETFRLNSNKIYESINYDFKERIAHFNNNSLVEVMYVCLEKIEKKCRAWKVHVDTSDERERIKYFNFYSYIKNNK